MHQTRLVSILVGAALAGLAALLPNAAHAQTGKLAGTVTDAESGQPVEGVQVVVQGTGIGAVTSANGRYFIVSVAPGTYTIVARRIGYQPVEQSNVQVRIDVTREVNFRMSTANTTLAAQRIVAESAPLIERGVTGSNTAVTSETIDALPVTNVAGVLALQQGFLEVPQNTDILSFTETQRNVATPLRIRGGRGGETLTLIDGIPVNNIVFGGPAFDLTTSAVQQLDYQRGGFEPQYGNALSGIINIATKEGGDRLAGNVEWQTSGFGATLGSTGDELKNFNLYRGYLSGPIPATNDRVKFMVAGQQQSGRDRVFRFDDEVFSYARTNPLQNPPNAQDLFPGYRGFGFDSQLNLFGKVTVNVTPSSKLNLTVVEYERQRQPFEFENLFAGIDVFGAPAVRTLEDSIGHVATISGGYPNLVMSSISAKRRLLSSSLEQRFGRSIMRLRAGRFSQSRNTCNFFQGVCTATRFADQNFNEQFNAPGVTAGVPYRGTGTFFGGEEATSYIGRADIESQVTDHHNLQAGLFYQTHDVLFRESRNVGVNNVEVANSAYKAKPWDAAAYLQDRIEYDFLTVKLGFRFDYGVAKGTSFANPLDPTNGTTAREVCEGRATSLNQTTVFTFTDSLGQQYTGVPACNQGKNVGSVNGTNRGLLDSATALARVDDFKEAEPRVAFSPRVAVNFPLTARTSLFFNFGRYSQNPLYNNLYQNTGIGTVAGAAGGICDVARKRPNSPECDPVIFSPTGDPGYLGNPGLLLERTTAYEVGYAAELGNIYALTVLAFSKDQAGLSGLKNSNNEVFDVGSTYGVAAPRYSVLVNQDYGTTRGVDLQFRRRTTDYWGFDINYSFSKSAANSPPPERRAQSTSESDPTQRTEIRSEIDQPHVFNASLMFNVGQRTPEFRFGNWLRQSYLTFTGRAASGLPYTPTTDIGGFGNSQLNTNSGRGPATFQVDALAGKDFGVRNIRYGAFVRVANLFDRDNCVQVFTTTGRCDAGTVDQSRRRTGNFVGDGGTSTFFNRAHYFGERRNIFAGLKVGF